MGKKNFQALVDTILTIPISTWQQCTNTQWIQEGVTIEEIVIHRIQINAKYSPPLYPTTLHFDLELVTFHPKYISCYITLTFFFNTFSKHHSSNINTTTTTNSSTTSSPNYQEEEEIQTPFFV